MPYHYQMSFSDETDSDNNEDVDVEQNPIDLEWALYKKCAWKMYGSETATCLDWWRAAVVRMPHLAKLVRWSWSCQASSCASECQFSQAGFINNRLRQGQMPSTLWEASLLSNILPDKPPQQVAVNAHTFPITVAVMSAVVTVAQEVPIIPQQLAHVSQIVETAQHQGEGASHS